MCTVCICKEFWYIKIREPDIGAAGATQERVPAPFNPWARLYFLDFSCQKYVWARYFVVTLKKVKNSLEMPLFDLFGSPRTKYKLNPLILSVSTNFYTYKWLIFKNSLKFVPLARERANELFVLNWPQRSFFDFFSTSIYQGGQYTKSYSPKI